MSTRTDPDFQYLYTDDDEQDDDMSTNPWAIDEEGRIFHDGRFVALIERTPANDSPFADSTLATFMITRVTVDGPDERMRSHARPFESSISGTSARVVLSDEEWNAINRAAAEEAAEVTT